MIIGTDEGSAKATIAPATNTPPAMIIAAPYESVRVSRRLLSALAAMTTTASANGPANAQAREVALDRDSAVAPRIPAASRSAGTRDRNLACIDTSTWRVAIIRHHDYGAGRGMFFPKDAITSMRPTMFAFKEAAVPRWQPSVTARPRLRRLCQRHRQ